MALLRKIYPTWLLGNDEHLLLGKPMHEHEVEDRLRSLTKQAGRKQPPPHSPFPRILFAILIAVLFAGGVLVVHEIETTLMPVVSRASIVDIEHEAGSTYFRIRFEKLRKCKIIDLAWYRWIDTGTFEDIRIKRLADGALRTRPIGVQLSPRFVANTDPATLRNKTFATVTHRCHPFWTQEGYLYK